MSGGVDSSLTLQLLRELPLNLSVIFMRNWDPLLSESSDEHDGDNGYGHGASLSYGSNSILQGKPNMSPCEWERDWADVRRVCAHVGVPERDVRLVDLSREYWSRVFEPAVAVWEAGNTPNPDVACNR
jgi:tRNA-specific 2-thiouridylase